MWQLRISQFLSLGYFLAILVACTPSGVKPMEGSGDNGTIIPVEQTPVTQIDVSWLHDPQARIARVTFCCSPLMSPNEEMAYLPEAQILGDGKIIWVERGSSQRSLVGFLSDEQMVALLKRITEAGFFNWEDHYSSEYPPTDTPSRCIEVHLEAQSKQVCELEAGAPPAFEEIYTNLTGGAGVQGKDYVPEIGYLSGFRLDESVLRANGELGVEWPAELGIPPAEAIQGVWIEGEPLAEIWRAARANVYHLPAVVDHNGAYRLVVQVPGVSWIEPPDR